MSASGTHAGERPRRAGPATLSPPALALAVFALALAVFVPAFALAGCGLGAGSAPSAVSLRVTRDFGAQLVRAWSAPRLRGQETVMSLLTRNASVSTRYGGGFVQSIDGLSGGQLGGQPVDWFYYVNGIEAPIGAAERNVHAGDHVWWDRHDWSQTDDVPAVVGSFPEPFLNGIAGKRLPVRVECALVAGYACRTVSARLRALGVPAAIAALGAGAGASQTLRLAVAPWPDLAGEAGVQGIALGPRASGVYARFSAGGSALTLLDQDGRAVRTLRAGSGLIAAARAGEAAPEWVITGTDATGVERAAGALTPSALRDRFALAVTPAGAALPVPQAGA